ncbi:ROK family protein [Catenulispora acidiphila DSM 44928]|uniref:ROK family protein n=1 Tax=Catenulispora acidiphila (strain DSM 44928 / JCM 14897 / NBRC 102108 / NRRL B-24433 / ID139908) TaxID=479433 RepID=C7QD83_CATAD|nr:ROK family protein [Catenulispora acidiphila]ACU72676.1 ROK family protein [Catenulispora acidiphila DSM 44928]
MKPVIGDHPDTASHAAVASRDTRTAAVGRRAASAGGILRTVLGHGPAARSTIGRLTGLSPASMTGYCTELIGLGLLRDLPDQTQSNGLGRPHLPVDIDTARHVVGAVHIAVPHVTVAVLDLRGRVLASRRIPHLARSADSTVRHAARCLLELLRQDGAGAAPLGIGVACGGWVDQETGVVVEHTMLGWSQVRIRDLLREHTGLPVYVDGHSRALLHGERLFGAARGAESVLHLFVGNVVEAAFALGDAAHYGPRSQAGAIAHLRLADSTEHCPCGRTGCFQAAVSERTVTARAVESGVVPVHDFPALLTAARTGHRAALDLLVERARLVGQGAAMLIDVFDPELVVVAEQAVTTLPSALAALRAEVAASSRTRIDAASAVVPSSFAGNTLAIAGGSVILNALYRDPLAVAPRRSGR